MGCRTGALGACGTFAQILVFLVNTVLFAGSVLLVTGSALLLQNDNSIAQFIDANNPNQVAYIGICLGSVTAFITFFGCAGSCLQNKQIIRLYLVMLVILFILFLTIIILCVVYQKSFKGNLGNGMQKTLDKIENNQNKNETESLMKIWNEMQKQVQCCGLTRWENWDFTPVMEKASQIDNQNHEGTISTTTNGLSQGDTIKTTSMAIPQDDTNISSNATRKKREAKIISSTESNQQVTVPYISQEVLNRIPESCFRHGNKTIDELYKVGCRDKAKDKLQFYVNLILIASGGVAIVLVFSIFISCWLLKSVKKALAYNF